MAPQQQQPDPELFDASKEVAATLLISSKRYADIRLSLAESGDPGSVRRDTLSTALLAGQSLNATLEVLGLLRKQLPEVHVPPMMALLLLGGISTSCLAIGSSPNHANMKGAGLLSPELMDRMLKSQDVDGFLTAMLE